MRGAWESMMTGVLDAAGRVVAARSPQAEPGPTRPRGPVVLVGGLATTESMLVPMACWLGALGHRVTPWAVGSGLGCARRAVGALEDRVAEVADEAGEPVHLVGHSRGGQFARVVATRRPDDVAALVTLGSPFDPYGVRLPMLMMATAIATAGSCGAPGVFGLGCFYGACCREFRDELRAPWPDGVPFTSIFSRTDRAVPWHSSSDPSARNVVVPGGHTDLLHSRTARRAVADALARVPCNRARAGRGTPAVAA